MISDFREIAYKSGGLRAGLYRGFLPVFVVNTIRDTKIDIQPNKSLYDKLGHIKLALIFMTININ